MQTTQTTQVDIINLLVEAIADRVAEKLSVQIQEPTKGQQNLTLKEVMERYQMSHSTALRLFQKEGSPAYKMTSDPKAPWRVDAAEFDRYIKKNQGVKG